MATQITFRTNPRLTTELGELAVPMLARLALQVESEAKRRAPVKTGNLRRSITSAAAMDGGIPSAIVAATVHYAGFVELGTRYVNAQPFLRPALVAVIGGAVVR